MESTSLFEAMKSARVGICTALVDAKLIEQPVKHTQPRLYSTDQYPEEIHEESIRAGVIAFAAVNNIQGGSVAGADVWLYDLLHAYLANPAVRKKINVAIGKSAG